MANKTMTREEMVSEIEKRTNEILEHRLENIEKDVNTRIDQVVNTIIANSLGFTDSWGRVEIDHCNGRRAAIANAIGEKALALVESRIPDWFEQTFPNGKIPREWMTSLKNELREQLGYKLMTATSWKADEMADKLMQGVIDSLAPKSKE